MEYFTGPTELKSHTTLHDTVELTDKYGLRRDTSTNGSYDDMKFSGGVRILDNTPLVQFKPKAASCPMAERRSQLRYVMSDSDPLPRVDLRKFITFFLTN